jgi:hypothetical protein
MYFFKVANVYLLLAKCAPLFLRQYYLSFLPIRSDWVYPTKYSHMWFSFTHIESHQI